MSDERASEAAASGLDAVLALISARRGVDFQRYRRATMERRVQGRMRLARASDLASYHARLAADPAEADHLLEYLTIKVSRFFRDAEAFAVLRRVAPELTRISRGQPPRAWSAGCGNGEESYSLAIVLAEAGLAAPSLPAPVIATDIDERALAAAAAGRYPPEALDEVPAPVLQTYFHAEPGGRPLYRVDDSLRARVQFQRHDLSQADAPPAGAPFALICCRNVLIYFQPSLRDRVQRLLYESLLPGGYLCLGESEWLALELQPAFEVVDRRARVFRRRTGRAAGGPGQ